MGEIIGDFALKFNGSIRLEAREKRLTGETGALLLRQVEERLGLSRWLMGRLKDPRDPERITHSLEELVRTHLLLLGQGWRDQDDADELRQDAALRLGVSERKSTGPLTTQQGAPQGLASQPTLSRTEGILAAEHNREDTLLCRLEQRGTAYVARVRNTSVLKDEAALPRFLHSGLPRGEPGTYLISAATHLPQ